MSPLHPHPALDVYRRMMERSSGEDGFVIESVMVIERALQSPWPVESIVGTPHRMEQLAPLISPKTERFVMSQSELNALVGFSLHRGCAAHVRVPEALSEGTLPAKAATAKTIVVAERIADPANIGALLRNCRAFGVDLVILDPKGGTPFCRKAARTSAGHLFTQDLCVVDPLSALQTLREVHGGRLQACGATVGPNAHSLRNTPPAHPWALFLGNEGGGLSEDLLKQIDREVTIPMQDDVDSLNVAAASAVLLYGLTPA